MSDALEIKPRTHLVNAKITYAVELQSVMRELLTEVRFPWVSAEQSRLSDPKQASGHRMELIIIALIAFEATLVSIEYTFGRTLMCLIIGFHSRRTRDLENDNWKALPSNWIPLNTMLLTQ